MARKKIRLIFDDVLDFWSKNAQVGIYPTLCQLANIHLSASAASVPVESMFPTAGLVANSKRSSISAERLHRVCFVHDNNIISLPLHKLWMWTRDRQFLSSLLHYMYDECARLQPYLRKNVGSQPNFSRIFLLIAIIRLSRISADFFSSHP